MTETQEVTIPPAAEVAPAKAGFKTTEMWLTLASIVFAGVKANNPENPWVGVAEAAIPVLGSAIYTWSRTRVKERKK